MKTLRKFLVQFTLILTPQLCAASDYFPHWTELDEFSRNWYSKHLAAMDEEALAHPKSGVIHRFLWLRSFHKPISVSVSCVDHCELRAVKLSGAGGYDPGEIEKIDSRKMTDLESQEFLQFSVTANLWQGQPPSDIIGTDGARWIVESIDTERYVVWDSYNPAIETRLADYRELCLYMLELAGFEIPEDEIY